MLVRDKLVAKQIWVLSFMMSGLFFWYTMYLQVKTRQDSAYLLGERALFILVVRWAHFLVSKTKTSATGKAPSCYPREQTMHMPID